MNGPGAGKLFFLALVLAGLVFVPGLLWDKTYGTGTPGVEITALTTDKNTYGSHEDMEVSVFILSSKRSENVTVSMSGIRPYSHAYVKGSRTVNLSRGENEVVFYAKTPHCTSGCGGVYPGPYDIGVEILINGGQVANSSATITLVEG